MRACGAAAFAATFAGAGAQELPPVVSSQHAPDINLKELLSPDIKDYVVKPVEPRVLLARIGALLRRSRAALAPERKALQFGRLSINTTSRSVHLDGQSIALSGTEFDLLLYLASHAGEIQSRETLFKDLFKREYDGMDRMLDIRISRLRRKLGDEAETAERIKTIWGQGYLFVPDAW